MGHFSIFFFFFFCDLSLEEIAVLAVLLAVSLDLTFFLEGNFTTFNIFLQIL